MPDLLSTSRPSASLPAGAGCRRPSLASRKAELHRRLLEEDAAIVADDLLALAKAGDLPAIQLLLSYTIGNPAIFLETDDSLPEPTPAAETATGHGTIEETAAAPPAVTKPTIEPPTPAPRPPKSVEFSPLHRRQTDLSNARPPMGSLRRWLESRLQPAAAGSPPPTARHVLDRAFCSRPPSRNGFLSRPASVFVRMPPATGPPEKDPSIRRPQTALFKGTTGDVLGFHEACINRRLRSGPGRRPIACAVGGSCP